MQMSKFGDALLIAKLMQSEASTCCVLHLLRLDSAFPLMQALQGFDQSNEVEVWLLVPTNMMSAYASIPVDTGAWPDSVSGKNLVCKIVGLDA